MRQDAWTHLEHNAASSRTESRVEAGGNDHQVWLELAGDRENDGVEGRHVVGVVISPAVPPNVDVVARALALADFARRAPRAWWVERALNPPTSVQGRRKVHDRVSDFWL